MSIALIYCVTLALAATVTLWLAPISLWQKSAQAGDLPEKNPSRLPTAQTFLDLHIQREGLE